jgi:hypothetical protein
MKITGLLFLTLALAFSACAQDTPKVEIPLGFSMINVHPNLDPVEVDYLLTRFSANHVAN